MLRLIDSLLLFASRLFSHAFAAVARLVVRLGVWSLSGDLRLIFRKCAVVEDRPGFDLLGKMIVLAEDCRFEKHWGFDFRGILRSLFNNMLGRPLQGASTLEQQLVRSITGHCELTLRRKLREILLASQLRRRVHKHDVIRLLMTHCWLGCGGGGFRGLATRKGIELDALTVSEAAYLVAHLRFPEPAKPDPVHVVKVERRALFIERAYRKLNEAEIETVFPSAAIGSSSVPGLVNAQADHEESRPWWQAHW